MLQRGPSISYYTTVVDAYYSSWRRLRFDYLLFGSHFWYAVSSHRTDN